ncbi:outer membrane beta-barrel protein [Dyadobacter sp. NIV53]|uniref:outer membrane beta-barrel protein n=1 Tax=Dyadobacter sp. NIV53 TaxID=2861765 RepID=UPI001C86D536|nr:outer membrane beta-barrel protein [Dyadobacter sp. NIV53]
MKNKIYLTILLILVVFSAKAHFGIENKFNRSAEKDSIIVTFGDKTRLIIYGENRKELQKIMKYDLNALLSDLQVRLDSSDADTTYLKEEFNGNDYLKDKTSKDEKDYVRIGMRGIHIKDGGTEVTINAKGVEVKDEDDNDSTNTEYRRTGKHFYRANRYSSPRKGFNVAIGLNTYGTNKATAGYDKADYDLRPFGSRYISLGYIASATVAKGKNAKFSLDFGADFSWNNLMFDGNETIVKTADGVDFKTVKDAEGKDINFSKNKLVLPYVNLSFMPTISFSKSFISYISAGVYGGYRLGSYTKTKEEGSKDKDHVRTNFYINDLRYGAAVELGIRNFPDLFVNYDMNNVFTDNHGPTVRMLNFGIRLF